MASSNLKGRGDGDKSTLDEPLLTPKSGMTIGCLADFNSDLERFQWNIIGIAETHWGWNRRPNLPWIQNTKQWKRGRVRSGVALVLGKRVQDALLEFELINERNITARFRIKTRNMTICHDYAQMKNTLKSFMKSCNKSRLSPKR